MAKNRNATNQFTVLVSLLTCPTEKAMLNSCHLCVIVLSDCLSVCSPVQGHHHWADRDGELLPPAPQSAQYGGHHHLSVHEAPAGVQLPVSLRQTRAAAQPPVLSLR